MAREREGENEMEGDKNSKIGSEREGDKEGGEGEKSESAGRGERE